MNISQDTDIYKQIISFQKYKFYGSGGVVAILKEQFRAINGYSNVGLNF